MKRGDIYYIDREYTEVGSEMRAGRPAVIVSNDIGNENAEIVEVVWLTTQPKKDLPTHVAIRSTKYKSTALCEKITTVAKKRIGEYCGTCTDNEMQAVENAMMVSLGIDYGDGDYYDEEEDTPSSSDELVREQELKLREDNDLLRQANIRLTAERDLYDRLYHELLGRYPSEAPNAQPTRHFVVVKLKCKKCGNFFELLFSPTQRRLDLVERRLESLTCDKCGEKFEEIDRSLVEKGGDKQ